MDRRSAPNVPLAAPAARCTSRVSSTAAPPAFAAGRRIGLLHYLLFELMSCFLKFPGLSNVIAVAGA
jgi:hypothetical protein